MSFVHDSGATGEKLLPETMVGGVAWFDMDGDQDPDLLLTGGAAWPWDNADREVRPLGLYRNDAGQFVDVTAGSGSLKTPMSWDRPSGMSMVTVILMSS